MSGASVMHELLSRDEFRRAVFERDGHRCVICGIPAQDAHHILERRLFPDGGYYVGNGASLCGPHHIVAEATTLSAQEIRDKAGITAVILPPHLYPDEAYDKWGNIILPNGRRLKGELFDDASVQRICGDVLHTFDNRVKYPRTWHLPWSESKTSDDRTLAVIPWDDDEFIVVTEKMDGECTTLYRDGLHARSTDSGSHPSRNWIKNLHANRP